MLANSLRDGFSGWKADSLAALEVSHCQRMEFLDLARTSQRDRERDQRRRQASVDLLRPLRRRTPRNVKHQRPIDALRRADWLEPDQIRKQWQRHCLSVDLVAMPNLRVTVAVRRVCKFQRDERLAVRSVVPPIAGENQAHQVVANQSRQELACYDRLVVPTQFAGGRFEQLAIDNTVSARSIHKGVVRARKGKMHLRHEHVRIISWVANDCSPFSVAENIATAIAKQELGGISALKQKRMADRPIAISALEVQPR